MQRHVACLLLRHLQTTYKCRISALLLRAPSSCTLSTLPSACSQRLELLASPPFYGSAPIGWIASENGRWKRLGCNVTLPTRFSAVLRLGSSWVDNERKRRMEKAWMQHHVACSLLCRLWRCATAKHFYLLDWL